MLRAGALGYLLKESAPEELINGIRAAMRGEVCLSAAITGIVVSQYMKVLSSADIASEEAELTTREREVVVALAEGNSAEEIASLLKLSPKTVESTRRRAMKKLGVGNVAELSEVLRERGRLGKPRGNVVTPLPVIRTKLHPPAIPADLVPRSEILRQLDRFRERPFTLVSAPAGYGKSTLASSWLQTCGCPSAWLSLDEDADDLRSFLNYFVAAVRTIFPDVGNSVQALIDAPDLPPLSVLTDTLLNDLDEIDEAFILVLDDYHRISERTIHDLISGLLRNPPLGMDLVLLARRDPPLHLGTLRSLGRMNEISSSQLRFSPAETAQFLKNALDLSVDGATAAAIDEKIEGWPAGLRLMSHSLGDRTDLKDFVSALEGGFAGIMDYLVAEVLSRQPPPIADCLLRLSVLDRFCAPLREELCSPQDASGEDGMSAPDFISRLQANNLFVISLDTENYWFRYHHLFQQLLQNQLLSRLSKEDISSLHSRASAWFGENGLIEEALKHALTAGDIAGAVKLVKQNRKAMLESDRWHIVEKWLSEFPDRIIQQYPELLMARVWALYHHFDLPAIPPILDLVESLQGKAAIEPPLRAEIDFFRGYILYFQNEGARSLKHLQNALKNVPEDHHEVRGQIEILRGLANQMEGREEEAINTLQDLINDRKLPKTIGRTRLLVTVVYISIISGDLNKALMENQQLHEFARKGSYTYADVWSVYLSGLIHFYRNDLDEAINHFKRGTEHRHILHTRAAVDCMAGLAFAHESRRQSAEADAIMQLLRDYVDGFNNPAYMLIAQSCSVRLAIMRGDLKTARGWLGASPPPENMIWWLEIPAVTYCRALHAKGSEASLKEAEKNLGEYLHLNHDNHNTCQMIQISALLAAVHQSRGKKSKALTVLKDGITMAQPGGFIRPFVELGLPMAELLKQLHEQGIAKNFIETILEAIKDHEQRVSATVPAPSSRPQPLLDPLTDRELEVLDLIAERLYYKEIAEHLHISTETVKTHLRHIYQKLLVDNRRQAVSKARDLGMIPRQ
jgi:LuxR family maltose regulon positive regulatory protein